MSYFFFFAGAFFLAAAFFLAGAFFFAVAFFFFVAKRLTPFLNRCDVEAAVMAHR